MSKLFEAVDVAFENDRIIENEGKFTLEYLNKDDINITKDYFNDRNEAIEKLRSLANTYKEQGTENAESLELYDENNNVVAIASAPNWEVTVDNVNESLTEDSNEAYDLVETFEDMQFQFFTVDEWNAMDRDMTYEEQEAHHKELLEPVVEAFIEQNEEAIRKNWKDFYNQMENENHHTALAMFKEKLNIEE